MQAVVANPLLVACETAAEIRCYYIFPNRACIIGRMRDCDVVIAHAGVSRRHASIWYDMSARSWMVVDLGSRNGTYVGGRRVQVGKPEPWAAHRREAISFAHVVVMTHVGDAALQNSESSESDGTSSRHVPMPSSYTELALPQAVILGVGDETRIMS